MVINKYGRQAIRGDYHGKGTDSAVDDQVSHVSNEISSEANVEEHVDHVEYLLPRVDRVKVTVSDGGERNDRPIDGVSVPQPDAPLLKVCHLTSDPRVRR